MQAWLLDLVTDSPFPSRRVLWYRYVIGLAVVLVTGHAVLDTVPDFWLEHELHPLPYLYAALLLLGLDYALRLKAAWTAGHWPSLRHYALSPYGIFDLLAVLPSVSIELLSLPTDVETIFSVMLFLKLARFSPALETLGAVIMVELRPLLSTLFIVVLLILFTSTVLYFAERHVNPAFQSVPQAMWWSVVTLATVGYGDVVPLTPFGRFLGGCVAILGLCMFALPASILASGFTEEMRRQNFVSTWHLVSKVPFFARLHANQIAELASLLRVNRVQAGEFIIREGELGETMYFIANGQVEVRSKGGIFRLQNGDFFGEIALLQQCPRTATVRTMTRCQLLILDVRDFQRFVSGYPNLMDEIMEVARNRSAIPAATRDDLQ